MVSGDRQRIIETNRSLRLIKNELESLLEKGVITDAAFDSINNLLPTEADISSAQHTPAQRSAAAVPPPPTAAPNNLNLNQPAHAPPSYNQSTSTNAPPPLPGRNNQPPPPPPPSKPVLIHAKALYAYAASDARDCSFDRDDRIAVYEYMNADWWMGRNLRTGHEGIFPKSYVEAETPQSWNNEKAGGYPAYQPPAQPQYGGYAPPPPPGNPYNANVPPMAVAEQGQGQGADGSGSGSGGSKMGETGKKFGKKLGNAAIFGAGATIGSNLVNSIF
ncbi:SH3 domain-containing protein [Cercophora scortea]|uniref:SH3 domain-containing protein n=1 Tax=Cercophora scortea TaxID=314031 RepID=A0AAE0J585_9PEZI|nr:SH3 domain-containing protein [Cercophora scortea]